MHADVSGVGKWKWKGLEVRQSLAANNRATNVLGAFPRRLEISSLAWLGYKLNKKILIDKMDRQ